MTGTISRRMPPSTRGPAQARMAQTDDHLGGGGSWPSPLSATEVPGTLAPTNPSVAGDEYLGETGRCAHAQPR